jgi:hypothetical protein
VRGLVSPTPEFFPERPDGSPRPLPALFRRTLEHAGLADVSVEVSLQVPEDDGLGGGGCASGACGPGGASAGGGSGDAPLLARQGSGYAVALPVALAASPPLLGAHLARMVAAIFLHEADAFRSLDRREADGAVDVAAVLLGFGVILSNGSHVVSKGCGGIRVARGTSLPVEEVGVALALFANLFGTDARDVRRHLEPTQKEAFDEAAAWVRANESVVRMLRQSPDAIATDAYRLRPARGWLARTLGLGRKKAPRDALEASDEELAAALSRPKAARPRDPAREARLAKARAIVDEALAKN